MVLYSWLALRWAIEQFKSEQVLFREAERLDLGLYLRRLLRDKEALPSPGQALFCFLLIAGLGWLLLTSGSGRPTLVYLGTRSLAFVATPPLLMALLLTRKPLQGLSLRWPPLWALTTAVALAVLLFLPGAELTYTILRQFPGIKDAIKESQEALKGDLPALTPRDLGRLARATGPFVVLALVQALCEELAFRGFILNGLRRHFRAGTAILLSSFLFALFQMNVFQVVPHFLYGMVMGILVVRGGSLLPAVLFHFVYNCLVYGALLLGPAVFPQAYAALLDTSGSLTLTAAVVGGALALFGAGLLWWVSYWGVGAPWDPAGIPEQAEVPAAPVRATPAVTPERLRKGAPPPRPVNP
jgi:sodium transport system permease protein